MLTIRTRRIEEQLRRDLSQLIHSKMAVSNLALISLSCVRVSSDLSHARIYVSFLQANKTAIDHTLKMLQQHAGQLRSDLAKKMALRTIPRLEFIYDRLIQDGLKIDDLIEKAQKKGLR